ncbi:hypothetical protein [Sulfuricurvum sp.]|uniref:hypothetical protein n=1 Tax=Sulfuricurvum sp. TaxID=2025608 RepID=UPI00262BA01C|nr:hypothetical protein [Sulfuricurvum sp.]MDD3596172.1 hypothetical protein [Sulfuricurvum sp.]
MKPLILALIATMVLNATDTTQNVDSIAVAPEFTGNCDNVVSFALGQKPALASEDYYVGSAVDVSQDMKVSWNIGSGGTFDGDGRVGKVTADANCLRPDVLEGQVKSKVDYYREMLAKKTNPIIEHISSDAQTSAQEKTTSDKYLDDFTFKTDKNTVNSFFGDFLAEIKEPYYSAQTLILLIFLFLSLISLGGDFIFYSLAKGSNSEVITRVSGMEVTHRFAIGLPLILILYGGGSSLTTRAQDLFAWFVGNSTNLANGLVNKVHVANAKYSIREISSSNGITANDLEKRVRGFILLEEKANVDKAILDSCMQSYNIVELKELRKGESDLIFPSSPSEVEKSRSEFEYDYVLHRADQYESGSNVRPSYFSVETCAAAESAYRDYLIQKPKLEAYFNKLTDFNPEKLQYIISSEMQKNIAMGWTSIALLPAQQAMQSQTSMLDTQLDKSAWDNVEFDLSITGFEKLYNTYQNFSFSRTIESMSQRAALLSIINIYPTISGFMEGAVGIAAAPAEKVAAMSEKGSDAIKASLNSIPIAGPILGAIVGGLTWGVGKSIALVKLAMIKMGSFYLATEAVKIMLQSLVYIIPILVTALVIAWWYVEIFAYMIMIPFAAAYALGENAKANILQFIVKGIGIAFKPMLIVIAVFLAVKGAALLESISNGMITTQELAMMAQANTVLDNTHFSMIDSPMAGWGQWLSSAMKAGMIQGVLFIAVVIIKIFFISGVILKLPGFMLGLFNINSESNGGEAIAQKISTVTKGI